MKELIGKYRQKTKNEEESALKARQQAKLEREARLEKLRKPIQTITEPYFDVIERMEITNLFRACLKDTEETEREKCREMGIGFKYYRLGLDDPNRQRERIEVVAAVNMVDTNDNGHFVKEFSGDSRGQWDIPYDWSECNYLPTGVENLSVKLKWLGIGWNYLRGEDPPKTGSYVRSWKEKTICCEISGEPEDLILKIDGITVPLDKKIVADRIAQLYVHKDIDRRTREQVKAQSI